jgi:hypothetical protein
VQTVAVGSRGIVGIDVGIRFALGDDRAHELGRLPIEVLPTPDDEDGVPTTDGIGASVGRVHYKAIGEAEAGAVRGFRKGRGRDSHTQSGFVTSRVRFRRGRFVGRHRSKSRLSGRHLSGRLGRVSARLFTRLLGRLLSGYLSGHLSGHLGWGLYRRVRRVFSRLFDKRAAAILNRTGLSRAGVILVEDAVPIAVHVGDLDRRGRLVAGGAVKPHIVADDQRNDHQEN